jgi:toxin ParE1/3/4
MRVSWTIPALRDLDQIQDFIAQDSPIAAYRLATELIGRTDTLLTANPNAGRAGRAPGTRELVLSGTPYIVVYRVRKLVEVVAVVHGAREWPDNFN